MRRILAGLALLAGLYLAVRLAPGPSAPSPLLPAGAETAVSAFVLICAVVAAAAALIRARFHGSADIVLTARDGTIQVRPEWTASLPFRRRIPVIVQEGHAAVAERRGRFSRVILPGLHELAPGESVGKVIVTRPRKLVASADCTTRDGVPVTVELDMDARILGAASPQKDLALLRPRHGLMATSPEAGFLRESVALAAHRTPAWEVALLQCARAAVFDVVSRTPLSEIYDFRGSNRFAIPFAVLADRVRSQVEENSTGWGIAVNRLAIGRVRLPPAIVDKVASAWIAANPLPETSTIAPGRVDPVTAGSSLGALRLFPVVGYGPAASLRELLRHRLGDVAVHDLLVSGDQCVPMGLVDGEPVDYLLRSGVSYFLVRVGPGGIVGSTISAGDYVLCEPGDSTVDAAVAAIALDRQVHLGRVARLSDHIALTTDLTDRQILVLTETDADQGAIAQRYAELLPKVQIRPLAEARVLGQGVVALRRMGAAPEAEPYGSLQADASTETPEQALSRPPAQLELAISQPELDKEVQHG